MNYWKNFKQMKKSILSFIIVFLVITGIAQKPGALIDIQHYEYAITLNDTDNIIKGKATIELLMLQDAKTITQWWLFL